MPALGERKTKNGVTGEWDGTTWRQVATAADEGATPAGPKVGERKTKNGVTGEWDGSTWRQVADEPEREKPSNLMGGVSALSAAGAAAVPALRSAASSFVKPGLATTASRLAGRIAGPANIVKQGADVLAGRQSPLSAAGDLLLGEGARRFFRPERLVHSGVRLAQRAVAPVANALNAPVAGGSGAPLAVPLAGGLAGVAGTAGFLGALQHDANRDVTIDYTKPTLDTAVAKVFSNMRDSEKNRGRSLDARMDDPNDVMFRPDDSEDVRAAIVAALGTQGGQ